MANFYVKLRYKLGDIILSSFYYIKHKSTKRKYVVLGNKQIGLGNRLFALANTYTWFGKDNITLYWMLDHWMVDSFNNLFIMSDAPGFKCVSKNKMVESLSISIIAKDNY